MNKLRFGNPVFEPFKVQTTCRSGNKWFEGLTVGEVIELCDIDGKALGRQAKVLFVDLCAFDLIPEFWIEINHDPFCRTRGGLEHGMDSAYLFQWEREACTVVGFILL